MNIYRLPDLYDEQYDGYRDDLGFYRRLAHDYGGPVLELGAGSGRLTAALARDGHQILGIELEQKMLERGRERLAAAGLEREAQLQQGDMRDLDLRERFPLIVAAFNTLMHLYTVEEQDGALARVAAHLTPAGAFAFDLFVPDFGPQGVWRSEEEWRSVGGDDGELMVLQRHDPSRQLVESRYLLDKVGSDGLVRRQRATLLQRYFTRFELERALRMAGFTKVLLWGDFDRRPLDASARHLVGLARR